MATRLLLIRHAETASNAQGRSQGHRDVPLNERGHEQTLVLAETLRDEPVAAVYASDSSRAVETARPIAAAHGIELVADARLREMDQGVLDGLTSAEMREGHAAFIEQWREGDPADLRMPGGETLREVQERMRTAIEEIAHRHAGATVVAVSHNLATRALLCHALGAPLAAFRRIRHEVASLAEVEVRLDAPWTVTRVNDQCHLPASPAVAREAGRPRSR